MAVDMPGGKIKAEVYAKYMNCGQAMETGLAAFISAVANGTAGVGTVIDGAAYGTVAASTIPDAALLDKSSENGAGQKHTSTQMLGRTTPLMVTSKSVSIYGATGNAGRYFNKHNRKSFHTK